MAGQRAAIHSASSSAGGTIPHGSTTQMKHRHNAFGAIFTLAMVALLMSVPGCAQKEKPLPEVEGVTAVLQLAAPDNAEAIDTTIVSWKTSTDPRGNGYVIYRAEQGIGATVEEKSEFTLQALTIATQYVDDDIRTSVLYPAVRYFYQVCLITPEGIQGPMSPETSVEYSSSS